MWAVTTYLVLSAVFAVVGAREVGVVVGLYTMAASLMSVVAGAALKFALFWGDKAQKIRGAIFALVIFALVIWISEGFPAAVLGYSVRGEAWVVIGAIIGIICGSRRIASDY